MAEEIQAVVNATPNDVLVSSFDRAALAELDDEISNESPSDESFDRNLDIAAELDWGFVHPYYRLCTPD